MNEETPSEQGWRPIVAALANDDIRTVYCRLCLGESLEGATEGMSPKRRDRVTRALEHAGLVRANGDTFVAHNAFAELLAAHPVQPRAGVERFMMDGKIDRYPMNDDERRALLVHVAHRAVREGEELSEAQVNERLTVFSDDHALLRRYLVDFEILERTPSGSSYALVTDGPGRGEEPASPQ